MARRRLRDEDIEGFLEIPSASEDGQDFSDAESDDDIEKIQSIQNFVSEPLSDVESALSSPRHHHHQCSPSNEVIANIEDFQPEISDPQPSTSGTTTGTNTPSRTSRARGSSSTTISHGSRIPVTVTQRKKRRFIWKKTSFRPPPSTFTGNTNLPSPIIDFETPLQYFLWFFDDDLLQHIVEEMHKFSVQKNSSKPFTITTNELKKFIGVCLIMSLAPLPNIRMYWASELGIPLIMQTMSLNHFKKICQFLHFNDNSTQPPSGSPGYDRLHKIRPILETLRKKCQSVPKREALSIDEQMCATKASNLLRQYLPNKPHKWGYKLLVLCDDRGFAYDFEIYSGMENAPELRLSTEPDLGASSNIVVRLARSIPKNQNFKLFFDNYYTSPELIAFLAKEGIQSLGTVNKCRLGKDLKIPSIKDLKKDKIQRSYSEQWVANCDNTDIVTVMWYDNKPVVLSSSFVGQEPIETARRYDKKEKRYIQVNCPQIIKTYNQHMGGVDLLDSFLGKYKIKIRTRKWYLRLFYHLLDVTLINCWLLYRRVGEQQNKPTPMKQKDFKFEVGKSLCMWGPSISKKRGRPSLSDLVENKRQKPNTSILPPRDVRRDGFEHFPVWGEKRQRCKYPGCKGKTFISCDKCRVELCLNKSNNCFRSFHQ